MERKGITVIGSSNVDFIMKVARLPRPGETITGGTYMQAFGGKGANSAVAAARAGGSVTFVTVLGDDVFADKIVGNLRADGVDSSRIFHDTGISTGTALIMLDDKGLNYLTVAPGANYRLTPERATLCGDLIAGSVIVLMQMEIPAETTEAVLRLAAAHGTPVMFNYAPARNLEVPVSPAMTWLVVNELEAGMLAGREVRSVTDAESASVTLLKRGPKFVVITLGAEGAFIASAGVGRHIPAFKVDPVDTTAAGDTFCGALAVATVEGRELLDAARFASAASAISVTRMGAQPSCPRRVEIDSFLEKC